MAVAVQPEVMKVIVYVFTRLALTSIKPEALFRKIKPEGEAENVPEAPPVILAATSIPDWHKDDGA